MSLLLIGLFKHPDAASFIAADLLMPLFSCGTVGDTAFFFDFVQI
jgi:hypothetical protein